MAEADAPEIEEEEECPKCPPVGAPAWKGRIGVSVSTDSRQDNLTAYEMRTTTAPECAKPCCRVLVVLG